VEKPKVKIGLGGEDQGKEKEAEEEFHRYNSSARGCNFGGEVERQDIHCRV
jgi:hypothetical protein